jgi:hypothetical protein
MRVSTGIAMCLSAALVIGAVATPAVAGHTTPGFNGMYVDAGDETCFHALYDSIRNDCPTSRRYAIPVSHYWNGVQYANISVTATDPLNPIYCELMTGWNGGDYDSPGGAWTSVYGSPQTLFASARFESFATGWVLCTVYPGGRINNVWFSGS